MSNGGGAIPSAAEAPDPNDVLAKLNAAATQATANFLQVMTLPLSAYCPGPQMLTRHMQFRQHHMRFAISES